MNLRNISLKDLAAFTALGAVIVGVVLIFAVFTASEKTREAERAWRAFETVKSERVRWESDLYKALGYGGFIHNFKNYVLRRKPEYFDRAWRQIDIATATIENLQTLPLSLNEEQALATIGETLGQYKRKLDASQSQGKIGLPPEKLDAFVQVDDGPAFAALTYLNSAAREAERNEDLSRKPLLLARIRKALGYGGFIHAFKNFALRGDATSLETAHERFKAAEGLIASWKADGATAREAAALGALSGVLEAYRSKLEIVQSLVVKGTPVLEVDRQVKVDDAPAYAALAALDREILQQIAERSHAVKETFRNALRLHDILVLAIPGLIVASILVAMAILYGLVINPISRISATMKRLAGGDFQQDIPEATAGNEVGDMARALSVFNDTALKYARAKEELEVMVSDLSEEQSRLERQAAELVALAEDQALLKEELAKEVATKDQFFSIVAHDLKSPFTSLLGMTQILAGKSQDWSADQVSKSAQAIYRSSRKVFGLLENLLEWARFQQDKKNLSRVDCSIRDIARESVDLLADAAGAKDIQLVDETPDLRVNADRNMILLVVRNLIANAIKFTPNGGRIEVSARNDGAFVAVSVSDTGAGVDPATADNLFRIDVKTTTVGTNGEVGTGLGLPLCNEMVVRHGGTMRVRSEEGKGATFTFTLPAAA